MLQENRVGEGVYVLLFEKINFILVFCFGDINDFLDDVVFFEVLVVECFIVVMQVFMECICQFGQWVEKFDKMLIDYYIVELDFQISCQLDVVMYYQEFQQVEFLWCGFKQLVDNIDYWQNVKMEIFDVVKDDLCQDFEDVLEFIQSGMYWYIYIVEYDIFGGELIGLVILVYEFDVSLQDVVLLCNIFCVFVVVYMLFIGVVGLVFFLKEIMEEVVVIKDIGNYFDCVEYICWKVFCEIDDVCYIGLVMLCVLGCLLYGLDIVLVCSFNYVEQVKGLDYEKYFWISVVFFFVFNMVKSFVNNGWCV